MSSEMLKIQDTNSIEQVLGCICKDTSLLINQDLSFVTSDFVTKLHRIIFASISNLVSAGYQKIDELIISNYLTNQPQAQLIYIEQNGEELVKEIIEKANLDNFDTHAKMVKKFSLLRELYANGIDISSWYNLNEVEPQAISRQNDVLLKSEIGDIIDSFSLKLSEIISPFSISSDDVEEFNVDEEVDDVLDNFERGIEVGVPFYNKAYTSAFYGKRKNNVLLESAGSGVGKSRRQIREAVYMSIPFMFNWETKKWEQTGIVPVPTLYISTELSKSEVISIMLAFLTGIGSRAIKFNRTNEEQKIVLEQAKKLIKKYKSYLKVVLMPNYDTEDITNLIKKYILKDNIKFIFFDYIHETEKLLSYYTRKTGSKLRADQMLFLLVVSLKALAKKHNLFIWTGTQINQEGMSGDVADARAVRGAKSIVDKVDFGCLTSKITPTDTKKLEPIIENHSKSYGGKPKVPNRRTSIYKNRDGDMVDIFVWSYMDMGTCREELLFITTNTYEPITYEVIQINMTEEKE